MLTLLNDGEWSKWSDGEIAKRCAVSREYVNRLRPTVTCDQVTSERTYTTKHGTTATMKTAGINVGRKNAREALVNDEPSPEAGPQAEAFQSQGTGAGTLADREGRHEGEAASVDLPTVSDEDQQFSDIMKAWNAAGQGARARFLAANNLDFIAAPGVAAEATGNDLREPTAAASGQIVREGDAPRETGRRDDGDDRRTGGDASCPDTDFPSAVASAEPEASPSPTPASGNLSDPHASSSRQADKAGTEPPPSVPATNRWAALRPHCLNPDCCAGVGVKHCHACLKARDEAIIAGEAAA